MRGARHVRADAPSFVLRQYFVGLELVLAGSSCCNLCMSAMVLCVERNSLRGDPPVFDP